MEGTARLGFGIMRLPQVNGEIDYDTVRDVISEYMRGDFCYFDLHPAYMQGKAQYILNEFVVSKYPRNRFLVANKMPYYGLHTYRDYQTIFFDELRACGVDYFDYYMLHAVTSDVLELHERIGGFQFLNEIKKEGRTHNIGISFHDKPELLDEILTKYPELDFVLLQINFYDWESPVICSRKCYEIARKHGKKIFVMEPIKGGTLAKELELDGRTINVSELAKLSLEFVASLSGVNVILSGMSEANQVIENRNTLFEYKRSVDLSVYQNLIEQIDEKKEIKCTNCKYCVKECPREIPIPNIISLMNAPKGAHWSVYRSITSSGKRASDCIGCGKCEKKCPQKLKIKEYMMEAARMFETKNGGNFYTAERNAQILIYLLKEHNIKKIITSPGAMNICFSYSVQQDGFFEIYSCVDERSAAYLACGLAEESGEPVVLTCTGATASRNYIPGLTEAFYRKLPVIAVTSSQFINRIGHNIPQMIDRTNPLNDIAKISVVADMIKDQNDEWGCEIALNKAILESKHRGGGPVHINLVTGYSRDFSVRKLRPARVIKRIEVRDEFPAIPKGKIGIFCGAHSRWGDLLTSAVDEFCSRYDAVVISDHTGNYKGKYGVTAGLIYAQENTDKSLNDFELIIHMGNVSGAYFSLVANQVWRVNPDGELCDTFKKLRYVFEMEEVEFFKKMNELSEGISENTQAAKWKMKYSELAIKIPEVPFSNAWIAGKTISHLPAGAVLHLGILNSLRCWNMFEVPEGVNVYSNTGGFGIDGCVSSLIGASLRNKDTLYYGVTGDLAFFYDMNSLGNHHIASNLRLIVVNNGGGTEFKHYFHAAAIFGDAADDNIAAMGHYGNKSNRLLKQYAESLGFQYMSARNKEEYLEILPSILNPSIGEKSMIIEVFTDSKEESEALKLIKTVDGKKETIAKKSVPKPMRLVNKVAPMQVVLWGTGQCFRKNLSAVEAYCKISYVCDNNKDLWNQEVVPGIKCISPEELSRMENVYVVIMIENAKNAFAISNQLLDIGIKDFDYIYNWLEYACEEDYI